jgi:hypothetical protein
MRLPRAVLALLLAACASPSPTYERGTLTRPPPAKQRPGVGLPLPGQPRPQVDVQPGPRPKRLLPPQIGPGIWAGDESKATKRRLPEPMIHGVSIPLPDDVEEKDLGHARRCEATVNEILSVRNRALGKNLADMFFDYRKCAAFRAWAYCMEIDFGPPANDRTSRAVADAIGVALAPFCRDKPTPDFDRPFHGAIKDWYNATYRGGR